MGRMEELDKYTEELEKRSKRIEKLIDAIFVLYMIAQAVFVIAMLFVRQG